MIADHNIKVNGRWIMAGEEYEAEVPVKKVEKAEKKPEAKAEEKPVKAEPKAESVNEEPKPNTAANRRKKVSK